MSHKIEKKKNNEYNKKQLLKSMIVYNNEKRKVKIKERLIVFYSN